jgi:CheY-like chemotaxis protein
VTQVGILIVDDDITSQRALKSIFDAEAWRVGIVPVASEALTELATGSWNLAIVNVALADVRGPLFAILRELALAEPPAQAQEEGVETTRKNLRVLYLVPTLMAKHVLPVLEREGLPYSLKPYHLNEFLEKVSELLVEGGAISEPIRSIGSLITNRPRRQRNRFGREVRKGAMFAPREEYQMTEEEMAEFEREEAEDRKKREKALKDREHL